MGEKTTGARSIAVEGQSYVIKVAFLPNGYSGPHAWFVVAFADALFGEDIPLAGPWPTKAEATRIFWRDFSGLDDTRLYQHLLGARNELLHRA